MRSVRHWIDTFTRAWPQPAADVAGLVRRYSDHLDRFVVVDALYPPTFPFDELDKARRLMSLLAHLEDPRASSWWSEGVAILERGGRIKVSASKTAPDGLLRSEQDMEAFLTQYLIPLIESIRADGYRDDLAGPPGDVAISSDGSLHKAGKAKHRFTLCRALGVPSVPVHVRFVHASWWETVTVGRSTRARLESARHALRGVAEAHRG